MSGGKGGIGRSGEEDIGGREKRRRTERDEKGRGNEKETRVPRRELRRNRD